MAGQRRRRFSRMAKKRRWTVRRAGWRSIQRPGRTSSAGASRRIHRSIRNGVTHQLKAGDVIVIPAGTGHWFTKIDDHIRYLMVRIDPDKILPLKDEAASQAYLKSPVTKQK